MLAVARWREGFLPVVGFRVGFSPEAPGNICSWKWATLFLVLCREWGKRL